MGIFAELLISDIQRRATEGDLSGEVAPDAVCQFKNPTPEQVEAALALSEVILTDVKDSVSPIRDMPFKTVSRMTTHSDREVVVLQWSPEAQKKALRPGQSLIRPVYIKDSRVRREHFAFSVQVDAREGSVRVMRPNTGSARSLVTEGLPLGIEGFLHNPQLIVTDVGGALLDVLARAHRINAIRS